MTAFRPRWLEWNSPKINQETPTQRTDKTDKSPSVSFVSASPKHSEGEIYDNDIANLTKPALAIPSMVELYPVALGYEWLADEFYQMRYRVRLPDPDDSEERCNTTVG